jgi:hypothetical protein
MKAPLNNSRKSDQPKVNYAATNWSFRALLLLPLLLFAVNTLRAATVTYNPKPTTKAGPNPCGSFPEYNCTTVAYFDAQTLNAANGGIANLFQTAWDAWDASGGGQGWTLSDGGALKGNFNVTTATAQQFSNVTLGGLTIRISIAGITLPNPGPGQQLVWVQGLELNYTPANLGPLVNPYYTMDTATLSNLDCTQPNIWCPPAYPYQYADDHFYDQPKAYYRAPPSKQAFFDADAYLALEDPSKKTLEVFDGVSYGFQNYVTATPEPGSLFLMGSGVLGLSGFLSKRLRTLT